MAGGWGQQTTLPFKNRTLENVNATPHRRPSTKQQPSFAAATATAAAPLDEESFQFCATVFQREWHVPLSRPLLRSQGASGLPG
eukprot:COSAG01_NODE_3482_length_6022_cov_61.122235_1_plen_84_part_00